jgi:PPOX class probable F420-dependent enzyme
MFDAAERQYVESARVGRLATADADGRPHAVPVCFAFDGDDVVSPLDEKPKQVEPIALGRVRDVRENPAVALIVDHYTETWNDLGWVQVRGQAVVEPPGNPGHVSAVGGLRAKYEQYADHALEDRPLLRIEPGSVRSWGELQRTG